MERISTILKKYISERVPNLVTNVFFQMFNGIEAMFNSLEYRLDITKRERNIITAQHVSSLRNLSAQNGFEPTLKIPTKGVLKIQINPKVFGSVGYPLYLPPYAIFKNKVNQLSYYYNSSTVFKITGEQSFIEVIEGELKTLNTTAKNGTYIERVYLAEQNIAHNSIIVEVNGIQYIEVKSFSDNLNVNDNKLFVTKFSGDIQNPIAIYIQNVNINDAILITYRLTSGEQGNIPEVITNFTTTAIIDANGTEVELNDDEISITNNNGFTLGSNGTDANSLRAAIGYNHGINLLFDDISYRNFINKFSTLLLQTIGHSQAKTINEIYISKRCAINDASGDYKNQYINLRNSGSYLLTKEEKINLSKHLEEFEYALTSHTINDSQTCNYAFQILFENINDKELYADKISQLLYYHFSKFFYDKYYIVNIESLLTQYMTDNNINFEYTIFNQKIEEQKLKEKSDIITPYIIKHDNYLPILNGNFIIVDSEYNAFQLFFDINIVSQ